MDPKRAKEVLTDIWGEKALKICTTYRSAYGRIDICGSFSHEEIQAIETWMRDPEGVVGA